MQSGRRYVAYYRVSTKRQGHSGLGLEAQRAAVAAFLQRDGWPPVKEFTEVESGKNDDRPELQRAFEACRVYQAVLVVAKLDRLARDAAFLLSLEKAGVEFRCCDMPDLNRFSLTVLAGAAEYEAHQISERTKAALAAAKARGVKLGTTGPANLKNQAEGRRRGREAQATKAQRFAESMAPFIMPRAEAGMTLRQIAKALEEERIPTSRGGSRWDPKTVLKIIKRLEP